MPKSIKLHDVIGFHAKDLISGKTGIIESVSYSFVGNIQYGISPKSTRFNYDPTAYSYDFQQVKVYPERFLRKRIPVIQATPKFALGQPVVATTHSAIYGYIHRITIFANGCIAYTLNKFGVDQLDKDSQHIIFEPMLEAIATDDPSFENVESFIEKAAIQLPVTNKPIPEERKTSGGPKTVVARPI